MKNPTSYSTIFSVFAFLLFGSSCLLAQKDAGGAPETEAILEQFVAAYRTDPMAMDASFGIKVGEDWWHVVVTRMEKPYAAGKQKQYTFHELGPHEVSLNAGPPVKPTWYFRFDDKATLLKIYLNELTASTAAAKSTGEDIVAFDIEDMEGFDSSQQDTALAYVVLEHFWKKEAVEVTRFSRDSSLPSHGAAMVLLYTMKDKRIGWFSLGHEEAANADRGLDKGQVPNLFIVTRGRGKARIRDQEIDLEPGMSIFVGPYDSHVFYNPNPEPLEGLLILFGDNIDYARGQSYLSFLEQEYAFYAENEQRVADQARKDRGSKTSGTDKN